MTKSTSLRSSLVVTALVLAAGCTGPDAAGIFDEGGGSGGGGTGGSTSSVPSGPGSTGSTATSTTSTGVTTGATTTGATTTTTTTVASSSSTGVPAETVDCGVFTCPTSEGGVCCYTPQGGQTSCAADDEACGASNEVIVTAISCQRPDQCGDGEVCCAERAYGSQSAPYGRTRCASECDYPDLELCDPDAPECPVLTDGQGNEYPTYCKPSTLLPSGYYVCGLNP